MPPPTYQSIHKHHKALCGPLPTCQHWKTKDIWLAITQTSWEHRRHRRSKNIFRGITMGIRPIWGINSLSPFILSLGLISWCSVPWGRGGGYSTSIYTGRLCPEVQPLTLLIHHFWRKRYPFHIPSIDKWYPFHIRSMSTTLHPF